MSKMSNKTATTSPSNKLFSSTVFIFNLGHNSKTHTHVQLFLL